MLYVTEKKFIYLFQVFFSRMLVVICLVLLECVLCSLAVEECSSISVVEEQLLKKHPQNIKGYEAIGDELHSLRHYERALHYHKMVLKKNTDVLSLVAVATDLKKLHQYNEALSELQRLPPTVLKVKDVALFKASLLDCAGNYNEAFKLAWSTESSERTLRDQLAVIDYLDHSIPHSKNKNQLDKRIIKRETLISKLVSQGVVHRHQLVPDYNKNIKSEKAVYDDWEQRWGHLYSELVTLLRNWSNRLLTEFKSLKKMNLLESDDECIGAGWDRYEVNPSWRPLPSDCSTIPSPLACVLMEHITKLSSEIPKLKVIRASYSSIPAEAHIRPHYGVTNGQLKFHLGLDIPGNCAAIRVNDTIAHWTEGDVIMIDDSFSHEVWNNCSRRRTVFQVVVVHPDIA